MALACANVLRGTDGAGLAYGTKTMVIIKTNRLAAELPVDEAEGRFVGGHARAATSTHLGKKHAHPFQVGPITLMHNGTVSGAARAAVQVLGKTCAVDSEEIAHALATSTVDETIRALESGGGAYALVWHDKRDSVVRFIRNGKRPLHFAKCGDGVLYSSERDDLAWAMSKKPYGIIGTIKSLNPHILVESPLGDEPTFRKIDVPITPDPPLTQYPTYYPGLAKKPVVSGACEMCHERIATTTLYEMEMCTKCATEVEK